MIHRPKNRPSKEWSRAQHPAHCATLALAAHNNGRSACGSGSSSRASARASAFRVSGPSARRHSGPQGAAGGGGGSPGPVMTAVPRKSAAAARAPLPSRGFPCETKHSASAAIFGREGARSLLTSDRFAPDKLARMRAPRAARWYERPGSRLMEWSARRLSLSVRFFFFFGRGEGIEGFFRRAFVVVFFFWGI